MMDRRSLLLPEIPEYAAIGVTTAEAVQMPSGLADLPDEPDVLLLQRITYGARQADVAQIREMGFAAYVDWQLDYQSIDASELETGLDQIFPALSASNQELIAAIRNETMGFGEAAGQLQVASIARQMFSPQQLFERLVEFWSDHFSINLREGGAQIFKVVDDRDVIRANALGRFRDMLVASARSPAMLDYLDNINNTSSGPNENYARELLELHTLGVDGGYTEQDVVEVARCFTGWSVDPTTYEFRFYPQTHDFAAKAVLGVEIPAGGGEGDALAVLDILAGHPSTAEFISRKLIRRFVSENPSEDLVSRMAGVFMATDGDITTVVREMLMAPEFVTTAEAKFKRPIDFTVSLTRCLNFSPTEGLFQFAFGQLATLEQLPFSWPAPNGFPDSSNFWINTNALITRWNASNALVGFAGDIQIVQLIGSARTEDAVLAEITDKLFIDSLSEAEEKALLRFARGLRPPSLRPSTKLAIAMARSLLTGLAASRYFQTR